MRNTIFIVLLLIFSSCKKNGAQVILSGKVLDVTNSNPVPYATVFVQKNNSGCISCNPATFATVTADANGNFSYTYSTEKNYSYDVAAISNNYFGNASTGGVSVNGTGNINVVVKLQPHSWLKLHFKNVSPYNYSDKIDYGGGFGKL